MSQSEDQRPDLPCRPVNGVGAGIARGPEIPDWLAGWASSTPARVLTGQAGPAYRSGVQLALQADHAFARDAVHAELDLSGDLGEEVRRFGLFEVQTLASNKSDFLLKPPLGRSFAEESKKRLAEHCPKGADLQIVIGDGLSATAVAVQVPRLLGPLQEKAAALGLTVGQPFVVRYCRVGILNEVGEILDPEVVVLLIGERPGLATAESLSAYMGYRPRVGHTDADRNLISNIHAHGVQALDAVQRILTLVGQMRKQKVSGVSVKEGRMLADGSARDEFTTSPSDRT